MAVSRFGLVAHATEAVCLLPWRGKMQLAFEVPEFSTSRAAATEIDADLVAIPIPQDHTAAFEWLDRSSGGELNAAIQRGEFNGKLFEIWLAPTMIAAGKTRRLAAVGVGPRGELSVERIRRVGSSVGLSARQLRRSRVAFSLTDTWPAAWIEALAEGIALANFDNGYLKSRPDSRFFIKTVEVATHNAADLGPTVERGRLVAEAINAARLLTNEPGNRLTPREFMDRGRALLDLPGVTTEVLDEKQMEELGMGLLLGVARGSAEPPRMLVARYEPEGVPAKPVLGLVGKGITFDTGGISLKPSDGMERMKDDMAGGATVIGALRAIAMDHLPLRVIAIVPSTENMPGGRAVKPGDILRGASGLTVEVNNTDAEGRLILGDGLWYARKLGATHLIDVATLTGACVVALGKVTTGLFGTDAWVDVVRSAAERGGERVWPLPLFEEYKESLKSEIADMLNSPGRPAGAITAAMFLKEFVDDTPWAHLDIAGTAWADEARAWTIKGATGVMIRTLVEIARTAGKNWP
jgi:leucyl aminopeptidase